MGYIQRVGLVFFIIGVADLVITSLSTSLNNVNGSFIVTIIGGLLFVLAERESE